MAYQPGNLRLVVQDLDNFVRPKRWVYDAVADGDAAIRTTNYFSDGAAKGMKVGDLVDAVGNGPAYKQYQVSATSGNAATVSNITAIA